MYYQYDTYTNDAIIRIPDGGLPEIMNKSELCWRHLNSFEEPYLRAIYLGQGCWEYLETIDEEKAKQILREWGYTG